MTQARIEQYQKDARIIASLQAKIDRADLLVREHTEAAIDRIMVKLNFTAETIEHSTTLGKLDLILEEVDNLQRKHTKVLTHPTFLAAQKENREFAEMLARGTW